ncbi:MAG TPA: M20 family metallo-hydrolase [Mycobacterium sp.]|nr:M20 family metallo-hydrolase [Mycobacterium sp.]
MTAQAFLADFRVVGAIGATPNNGVERQAATEEHRQEREWFTNFAHSRGWQIRIDGIGNLFALVTWEPGAPYIIVGSHLDSQACAGRFDGAYGVIAALHAADRIDDEIKNVGSAPRYNLAVVDWFNEEGARFAPAIMGSGVYVGSKNRDEMLAVTDPAGTSVEEALRAIGYLGIDEVPVGAGYVEIHIEQGPLLEREGLQIGAVEYSWCTHELQIEVLGEQSHTGATAMADRRDALLAAAKIIVMVNEVIEDFEPETMVASVSQLTVEPNTPGTAARRALLFAELRACDNDSVLAARTVLEDRIAELAVEDGVTINIRDVDIRPSEHFSADGVELTEKVCAEFGYGVRRMPTMAGHDSLMLNRVMPTVMVFVPSHDGLSHCEREFTEDDDLVAGLNVLTAIVRRMVHGELAPH